MPAPPHGGTPAAAPASGNAWTERAERPKKGGDALQQKKEPASANGVLCNAAAAPFRSCNESEGLGLDGGEALFDCKFRVLPLRDASGRALPAVTAVACGARHGLVVDSELKLWAFGDNLSGQCGVNCHQTKLTAPKVGDEKESTTSFALDDKGPLAKTAFPSSVGLCGAVCSSSKWESFARAFQRLPAATDTPPASRVSADSRKDFKALASPSHVGRPRLLEALRFAQLRLQRTTNCFCGAIPFTTN